MSTSEIRIGKASILNKQKFDEIYMTPNDTLTVVYKDRKGNDHRIVQSHIGEFVSVNQVTIFKNKEYLGAALHIKDNK